MCAGEMGQAKLVITDPAREKTRWRVHSAVLTTPHPIDLDPTYQISDSVPQSLLVTSASTDQSPSLSMLQTRLLGS